MGTLVLIGIRFLVFLLLDFPTKVEKEKPKEKVNSLVFIIAEGQQGFLLGESTGTS
mgnify:FL=1